MNKQIFMAWTMFFILIMSGVPFYWFAYRPKKIRADCLSISLNAAFTESKNGGAIARRKIINYYRSRVKLTDYSGMSRQEKEDALFLIGRQKDGYQICLELNGLKE